MSDPSTVPIPPITTDAVFVVNGGDSSITVIDTVTDEVAGTIELLEVEYPHHIYSSPDRGTLLVAVPGADLSGGHTGGHGGHGAGGAVLALDATTGALKSARRLDAPNHNAAYAPGGDAIWTSQITTPGRVLILDPTTLDTRRSIEVGGGPSEVTFDASGAYAFVANTETDDVSMLDIASGELVATIAVGDAPVGAWPGSDGRMYVDNEAGKSISVIDPATRAVVATFALGFTPALAGIAPIGDLWVADADNGRLVFLDPTTGAARGELASGVGAHAFAFAGAEKAYVTNQGEGTVTVVELATRTATKRIDVGSKPNGILFRPR